MRPARLRRAAFAAGLLVVAASLVGATAAITAATAGAPTASDAGERTDADEPVSLSHISVLPVPDVEQRALTDDICALDGVAAGLASGDDTAVIEAAGGGEMLRAAVAAGEAPCIPLDDPAHLWVVVNKTRPYNPIDYRPSGLQMPDGVRNLAQGSMRDVAAVALNDLVTAARDAGAGEIALESGFRSYRTQVQSYGSQVASRGVAGADLVSARPGYSEHQSGLTADVVACAGGCGSLDDLAATAQGEWIVEHAWEHGWIVRYESAETGTTGYVGEPWHLRYVGPDLARAYHEGGWRTLEDFFGLPAAPDYLD